MKNTKSKADESLFSFMEVDLAPKEKTTLAVEYIVQYPSDYTQRRFFKGKGGSPMQNADPFGASQEGDFEMNSLQFQLMNLESKF